MTRLAIYDQPAPTRTLNLTRPLKVDGVTVMSIEVRPVTNSEFADRRAGKITGDQVIAACAGLPDHASILLSDMDHGRIVEAIADLQAEACQMVLDARRAQFRVIDGGGA